MWKVVIFRLCPTWCHANMLNMPVYQWGGSVSVLLAHALNPTVLAHFYCICLTSTKFGTLNVLPNVGILLRLLCCG